MVQLVRHVYSPEAKRSRTENVGSLAWDADPDELPHGIRVAAGRILSSDDLAHIRQWLRLHGDPKATARREARLHRLADELRAQAYVEAFQGGNTSVLAHAATGLEAATAALPGLADACTRAGHEPRKALRKDYLLVLKAWEALLKAAQEARIAKEYRRMSAKSQGSTVEGDSGS